MNEKIIAQIQELPAPVKIIIEPRRAARIALRKENIIIRIPKAMNLTQKNQVTQELLDWAKKTIEDKKLYVSFQKDHFEEGDSITILGVPFRIQAQFISGNTSSIRILKKEQKIILTLPIHLSQDTESLNDLKRKLIIIGLNKSFLHEIQNRVIELNQQHFQAKITKISLRYTTSRWGSCSSNGSINLSTKLLLTPILVSDYVIIHELAHRFEMNHSQKFWNLVEKAMPEYKIHLAWLKKEGNQLPL